GTRRARVGPREPSQVLGRSLAAEGAEEAAALARVAGAATLLLDDEQQHVHVAVVVAGADILPVARGLALAPELIAATAPEPHPTGLERALQGIAVHPRDHQHLVGALLL